jgi:hypothetical protein
VGSLTTPNTVVVGTFESPVSYAEGYVFFTRGGNVMAQSFNEDTLRLEGDPVSLRAQLRRDRPGNRGFSVSTNGRFVFLPAPKTEPQLTWLDRTGRPVGIVGAPPVRRVGPLRNRRPTVPGQGACSNDFT